MTYRPWSLSTQWLCAGWDKRAIDMGAFDADVPGLARDLFPHVGDYVRLKFIRGYRMHERGIERPL